MLLTKLADILNTARKFNYLVLIVLILIFLFSNVCEFVCARKTQEPVNRFRWCLPYGLWTFKLSVHQVGRAVRRSRARHCVCNGRFTLYATRRGQTLLDRPHASTNHTSGSARARFFSRPAPLIHIADLLIFPCRLSAAPGFAVYVQNRGTLNCKRLFIRQRYTKIVQERIVAFS